MEEASMKRTFSKKELYELRNCIPINDLIRELGIPCKYSEGYFRFLCPVCNEFTTSTKTDTNLGRCFRCERNFNTIDLTLICQPFSFMEAATYLQALLHDIRQSGARKSALNSLLESAARGR
jgi:hypothetical protein